MEQISKPENKIEEFTPEDFNHYNQLRIEFMSRVGNGKAYGLINEFVDTLAKKHGLDNVRKAFLFHALVGSTLDGTETAIDKDKNNPINQNIIGFLERKSREG